MNSKNKKVTDFDFFGVPRINTMVLTESEIKRFDNILLNPEPLPERILELLKNKSNKSN